jgi:hypothetical protein
VEVAADADEVVEAALVRAEAAARGPQPSHSTRGRRSRGSAHRAPAGRRRPRPPRTPACGSA